MNPKISFSVLIVLTLLLAGCSRKPDDSKNLAVKKTIETVKGLDILEPGDQVSDPKAKLIWMRCSLGENWNGSSCDGTPREVTLNEAIKNAPKGWRVPAIRELNTITFCESNNYYNDKYDLGDGLPPIKHACVDDLPLPALHPAFITKQLDMAPGYGFWSSSIDKSNGSYANIIYFKRGQINGRPKNSSESKIHVRYVRDLR